MVGRNRKHTHNSDFEGHRRWTEVRDNPHLSRESVPSVGGSLKFSSHRKHQGGKYTSSSQELFVSSVVDSSLPVTVSSLLESPATAALPAGKHPRHRSGAGFSSSSASPSSGDTEKNPKKRIPPKTKQTKSRNSTTEDRGRRGERVTSLHSPMQRMENKNSDSSRFRRQRDSLGEKYRSPQIVEVKQLPLPVHRGRREERPASPHSTHGMRDPGDARKKRVSAVPSSLRREAVGTTTAAAAAPSFSSSFTHLFGANSKIEGGSNLSSGTSLAIGHPFPLHPSRHTSPIRPLQLDLPSAGSGFVFGDHPSSPYALAPLQGADGGSGEESNRKGPPLRGGSGSYPHQLLPISSHAVHHSNGNKANPASTSQPPLTFSNDGGAYPTEGRYSLPFTNTTPSQQPPPFSSNEDGSKDFQVSHPSYGRSSSRSVSSSFATYTTDVAGEPFARRGDRGTSESTSMQGGHHSSLGNNCHPDHLCSHSSPAALREGTVKGRVRKNGTTWPQKPSSDENGSYFAHLFPNPFSSPTQVLPESQRHLDDIRHEHRGRTTEEEEGETREGSPDGDDSEEDTVISSAAQHITNATRAESGASGGRDVDDEDLHSVNFSSDRHGGFVRSRLSSVARHSDDDNTRLPSSSYFFSSEGRCRVERKGANARSSTHVGDARLSLPQRRSNSLSVFSADREVLGHSTSSVKTGFSAVQEDRTMRDGELHGETDVPQSREDAYFEERDSQSVKRKDEKKVDKKRKGKEGKEQVDGVRKEKEGEKKQRLSFVDEPVTNEGDIRSYRGPREGNGTSDPTSRYSPLGNLVTLVEREEPFSPVLFSSASHMSVEASHRQFSSSEAGNSTSRVHPFVRSSSRSHKNTQSSIHSPFSSIEDPKTQVSTSPYPPPTAWCIPFSLATRTNTARWAEAETNVQNGSDLMNSNYNTFSTLGNTSAEDGSLSPAMVPTPAFTSSAANGGNGTNAGWQYTPSPANQHTFYFSDDRVEFSSEFDSGNLIQVERVAPLRYNVYTAMDCANTPEQTNNRQWFHFSIRGVAKGTAMIINVVGLMHCKMFTFDWTPVFAIRPGRASYQRLPGKALVTSLEQMPPTPGYPNLVYKMREDLDDSMTDFHPSAFSHKDAVRNSLGPGEGQTDEDGFSFFGSPSSASSASNSASAGNSFNGSAPQSHLSSGPMMNRMNSGALTFGTAYPSLAGRRAKAVVAGRKKKKKDFLAMSLAFEIRFDTDIPLKSKWRLGHPSCPAMYVASNYPYSYETLLKNISAWEVQGERVPHASSPPVSLQASQLSVFPSTSISPPSSVPIYFHQEVLCKTLDGLHVPLLLITDRTGIQQERMPLMCAQNGIPYSSAHKKTERPHKFDGKVYVVLTARVHPGECPSSHMMHGCIDFLLHNSDPRAACLRQKCVFFIVPMINPDGVVRGHSRTDARGVDLNRMYRDPSFAQHPSPYCIRLLLNQLAAEKKLGLYIDMHAHANKKGTFFYGNSMPFAQQIPALLYAKLVALNSPYFEFPGCNFTETNMYAAGKAGKGKDSSGRVVVFHDTGLPLCFTIEASHVAGKTFSPISPIPAFVEDTQETQCSANSQLRYCPATYADTGRGLLLAFLDLRGWNPVSRIPFGMFHSVRGVTLWIHRQLQLEMAERILLQGSKLSAMRSDSFETAAAVQSIIAALQADDIPEKMTIRDSRSLPPITVLGVREFLSLDTAARVIMQSAASGIPRPLNANGPNRRGNGSGPPAALGSPKFPSSSANFHD